MPQQFEKLDQNSQEDILKRIKHTKVEIPLPIELTSEEDEQLLNLLQKARKAEDQGDLKQAIVFYREYKEQYLNLKEEKQPKKEKENDLEFQERALECLEGLLEQGADKGWAFRGV